MTNFKPRPTTYNGIEMRSRLEAGFAAWLDGNDFEWEYEPRAFASEAGQYLPDFRLHRVRSALHWDMVTAYVEVKPRDRPYMYDGAHLDAESAALLQRLAIVWDSEPDAVLLLAQPDPGGIVPGRVGGSAFAPCLIWRLAPIHPDHRIPGGPSVVAFPYTWVFGPGRKLALAAPVIHLGGPWPDRYWEGP